MDKDRAQFTGEIDKRGALVDDVKERLGKQLKLFCRAECLPVLSRVVWELGLPADHGTCMMCESKQIETVEHLLFSCSAYQKHRDILERKAEAAYSLGNNGASLTDTSEARHTRVLLGARAGCGLTEDLIDLALKRFLRKAWKTRSRVTRAINVEFGRQDIDWAKGGGWAKPPVKTLVRKATAKSNDNSNETAEKPIQQLIQVRNPTGARRVARRKLLFV
jgi:hypothetical protein